MILNKISLTIAEISQYVEKTNENENLISYLKKFGKVSKDEAEKIRKEIVSLNNPKIREEHTIKVIDFLPKDHEEVNKIFVDASLNEEEINALLDIVKKY